MSAPRGESPLPAVVTTLAVFGACMTIVFGLVTCHSAVKRNERTDMLIKANLATKENLEAVK